MKRILRDALISACIFGLAMLSCSVMARCADDNNPFASSVFILAVALTSRLTAGYFFGIAVSVAGVVCVNTLYTRPFGEFNLEIAGYPLTFAVMLIVSVIISTLTTRIKQEEKRRTEAEKEKTRANLLRAVSHDLRTPLTSIIGASSAMLEDESLSVPERRELIREIRSDAQWLTRVTENILSVTKIASGEVRLKKEEEVAEEIVSAAVVKFRRLPESLPVYVERPEEILTVPMEATLIEQVLLNLYENAEFHGAGATRIDTRIFEDGKYIVFEVEDDGGGIPAELLPHIMDGSLHPSQQQTDGGRHSMGIGLSVCRSIIRAHGGDIRAQNGEKGAKITFRLPKGGNPHGIA